MAMLVYVKHKVARCGVSCIPLLMHRAVESNVWNLCFVCENDDLAYVSEVDRYL
jgi:hypothetical protein